jgi:hypothetical protein
VAWTVKVSFSLGNPGSGFTGFPPIIVMSKFDPGPKLTLSRVVVVDHNTVSIDLWVALDRLSLARWKFVSSGQHARNTRRQWNTSNDCAAHNVASCSDNGDVVLVVQLSTAQNKSEKVDPATCQKCGPCFPSVHRWPHSAKCLCILVQVGAWAASGRALGVLGARLVRLPA